MKVFISGLLGVAALTAVLSGAGSQPAQGVAQQTAGGFTSADARKVLDTYCVTCHNDRMKGNFGNLSLQAIDLDNVTAHAPELEKVVRKLQSAAMPPAGNKRPDAATYGSMTSWIMGQLDRNAMAHPNAGRTEAMHRLNRAEYRNAVRDLLGLEALQIDQMLPADDESYGFDNIAGVLGMSPTHL